MFTPEYATLLGGLEKFLAVDAARYLELGLRGNIVTVIGALTQLN